MGPKILQPVVLITGCTSGIGRALAYEFRKKGCRVFASGRSLHKLTHFTDAGIEVVQLDVSNEDSIKRAVEEVLGKTGRIDILVNNAGLSSYVPGIEISLDEVRELMETNFFGVLALTQIVAQKTMIPQRSGVIVMVSSMMGEIVTPWASVYAATKAALTRFSDGLRMELAPFDIRVITVKPGGIKSEIANNAKEKTDAFLASKSSYLPIIDSIRERSEASQHHPMPAEDFARKVVHDVLLKEPISVILGTNAWLLWFMAKIVPQWVSDYIFSKKFGLLKLRKLLRSTPRTHTSSNKTE